MKVFKLASLFIILPILASAETDIYIGVASSGREQAKFIIGMPEFAGERENKPEDEEFGKTMKELIRADLMFSRYFNILEEGPSIAPDSPDAWKSLGAQHLITAKTTNLGKMWTFSVKVYDLAKGDTVIEKYYRGETATAARAAHIFSDELIWRLTGKQGIAHTRIAYSNDSTGKKEIYSVDYDGKNMTKLTGDKSIALLPRWSSDGTKIYYTTYRYGNPDMFEIDLRQGKIRPFTTFQGLNLAGGISPDGTKMAMTLSRGKEPNIYILDMATKKADQLTNHIGADSSATYSPDGKKVAFVSDRSGNPQIHVIEPDSGKIQRLTRLNWCDSPSWSPSGEWIVFAGRENAADPMDIYLVDITGNQLRKLTAVAGSNEDPSWSPDGRYIAFTSTRDGKRQLYVMDADGSAPHLLVEMPGKSYTPAWSP